jgi:hypothetical protein
MARFARGVLLVLGATLLLSASAQNGKSGIPSERLRLLTSFLEKYFEGCQDGIVFLQNTARKQVAHLKVSIYQESVPPADTLNDGVLSREYFSLLPDAQRVMVGKDTWGKWETSYQSITNIMVEVKKVGNSNVTSAYFRDVEGVGYSDEAKILFPLTRNICPQAGDNRRPLNLSFYYEHDSMGNQARMYSGNLAAHPVPHVLNQK